MAISKEKKKTLDSVLAGINKQFGQGTIDFGSNKEEKLKVRYYSTGCTEVDIMLGGGMGKGRIIEIFGPESSGKTSLALETMAKEQKEKPDSICGYFETEESYDPEYAKMLGIDTDRLIYWDQRNVSAERGFDILRSIVESGQCSMILINSVAGLVPNVEIEKEMKDQNIGVTAKLMSKLMRVITGAAAKTGTTLIFINQLRDKVGVMYGDPSTTTGGRALAYYASQRIRVSKVKLDSSDPIKEDEGLKIHCSVKKNRLAVGNPYKQCDYYAIYGVGVDNLATLPKILEDTGVMRRAGAHWYYEDIPGSKKCKVIDGIECHFKSKDDLVQAIRSNYTLAQTLQNAVENKYHGSEQSAEEIAEAKKEEDNVAEEFADLEKQE